MCVRDKQLQQLYPCLVVVSSPRPVAGDIDHCCRLQYYYLLVLLARSVLALQVAACSGSSTTAYRAHAVSERAIAVACSALACSRSVASVWVWHCGLSSSTPPTWTGPMIKLMGRMACACARQGHLHPSLSSPVPNRHFRHGYALLEMAMRTFTEFLCWDDLVTRKMNGIHGESSSYSNSSS